MAKDLMVQSFYNDSANPKVIVDFDHDDSSWSRILHECRTLLNAYSEDMNACLTLSFGNARYVVTLESKPPEKVVVDLDELRTIVDCALFASSNDLRDMLQDVVDKAEPVK